MKTMSSLKYELDFSCSLGDIIEVLKVATIVELTSFQLKDKPNENYIAELTESLNLLLPLEFDHPYLLERTNLPSLILIITSDEGFLGELNILLVNAGLDLRKSDADEIACVGVRGANYLEEVGLSFELFPGFTEDVDRNGLEAICGYLLKNYLAKFGRVFIVYPRFFSLTMQRIEAVSVLPFTKPETEATPPSGLTREALLIEPSVKQVIRRLIELWLDFKILDIFWSSKQSEYAARIMHLEGSTQELSHLNERLLFEYFRQVHTLRDKSIREISASKALLEKGRRLS